MVLALREDAMSYLGFADRPFYRNLLRLAVPLVIQQVITTAMFLVDNMMVGTMGDNALSAVSLANQVSYVMQFLIGGITAAASSFASQFWGIRDDNSIRKTLGITILSSETVALAFALTAFFGRHAIMAMLTPDPAVQALGAQYLEIASLVYPVTVMTMSFMSVLRATEHVVLPTVSGICAICLNALLNYCLIMGHFGFPALGVRGAAIATLVASIVDMCVEVSFSYILKTPLANRRYRLFQMDKPFIRAFFRVGTPLMGNEGIWALSQSMIVFIFAQLGTQMSAAMSIFETISKLSLVALAGLGTASMVMLGKELGQGKLEQAYTYAQRFLRLAPWIGLGIAVFVNLVGPLLLGFYQASAEAKAIVRTMLLIYGLDLPMQTYDYVMIVGIMRAGGDSRYMMLLDAGNAWVFGVGTIALLAFVVPGIPPQLIYAGTMAGTLAKFVMSRMRFKSKKWMNNLTERTQDAAI